ncbi:MAG: RdgB/HAM1 family non-canonical purine NTP pyrophosphatase [Opitutales bacterium]|nr:RdgB/HAM1 family non-canonical purine NTP pyrophosphatase [Opitutales bacterium]
MSEGSCAQSGAPSGAGVFDRIVLASSNAGKVKELEEILHSLGVDAKVIPASGVGGMPYCEEDGGHFRANALIKALALSEKLASMGQSIAVLSDDSGLEVPYLGGEPGVHSARYAGPDAEDADNRVLLLERMTGAIGERRRARFICVLCLLVPGSQPVYFEGNCEGILTTEEKGDGGFGYDPLFVPEGFSETWGEMRDEVKNRISHRFRASEKLADYCKGYA